jgi:hypothetical protein
MTACAPEHPIKVPFCPQRLSNSVKVTQGSVSAGMNGRKTIALLSSFFRAQFPTMRLTATSSFIPAS